MSSDVLQILSPGLGVTLQDRGRLGWRRFGVPCGGAMDEHAALWANRLLDNPSGAPLLELLLQQARLAALQDVWIAVTGAEAQATVPTWRAVRVKTGEVIAFRQNRCGVWTYLAIEGGFAAPTFLGSASIHGACGIGRTLRAGDTLRHTRAKPFELPPGVGGRLVSPLDRRNYDELPTIRVWPAPQTGLFSERDRAHFYGERWTVSSQSDRVGYRLTGKPLASMPAQILSEPVRLGTIQVPDNGLPIVTMKDGPTVGGYPKLGVIDPGDLSWLAQCRPGQSVRFQAAAERVPPAGNQRDP